MYINLQSAHGAKDHPPQNGRRIGLLLLALFAVVLVQVNVLDFGRTVRAELCPVRHTVSPALA